MFLLTNPNGVGKAAVKGAIASEGSPTLPDAVVLFPGRIGADG